MMLTMGSIFMYSVFTFFVILRFFLQQTEFFEQVAGVRVIFFLFMFIYVLMILHMGSTVSRQVNI